MGLEIFSLEGKRALVTGASRGIGAAIALAYAEAGADVALAARTTEDLDALAERIGSLGRRAVAITVDVTDDEQVDACVARALDALGGLDVMVNNAGGTRFMSPAIQTRRDGWQKAMKLNLDSVFYFSQRAGTHMAANGGGSILNVASVAGVKAAPTLSYYGAAKAAVISLTQTMAAELGDAGVRVNALCPGWIKTDLNRKLWEDPSIGPAMVATQPIKRWGETDDLLGAAIYFASDASRYTTGTTLIVDGGQTAV